MLLTEQLDLFSWEHNAMERAHKAFIELNFSWARSAFEAVLEAKSGHRTAILGLKLCDDWEHYFRNRDQLGVILACEILWEAIFSYDFGKNSIALSLKKGLLQSLANTIEDIDVHLFSESGLCLGQVCLEMDEIAKGLDAFHPLLEYYPHDHYLLVHYGNALWDANESVQAKINYIKALLIFPSEIPFLPIKDQEMLHLIKNVGPYMAPIYEWVKQGMPPLGIPHIKGENLEHFGALEIFYMLNQANEVKMAGDMEQLASLGRKLKHQAPEIFDSFMEKIQTA